MIINDNRNVLFDFLSMFTITLKKYKKTPSDLRQMHNNNNNNNKNNNNNDFINVSNKSLAEGISHC